MGKTGKWIRSFLTGKKDKSNSNQINGIIPQNDPIAPVTIPTTTRKEKKRWSFRRSSAGHKDPNSVVVVVSPPRITCSEAETQAKLNRENEHKIHDLSVVNEEAAAAAAVKIQSVFRSYLARKALSALKGIVNLQALIRGHLVRKQATEALRCMQALVKVQARALAERIRMAEDQANSSNHRPPSHRKSTTHDHNMWNSYHDNDKASEDNIKTVEMDLGVLKGGAKTRKSHSNTPQTDISPRVISVYGDYSFATAQSSPQYYSAMSKADSSRVLPFAYHRPDYVYPFFPSYMAYTESSRAKVRSQSAPKQHQDSFEKQPRSIKNIPRAVKMQRSCSHQYPWSIKLDKSSVSIKDSECGSSTSTMLTNINYCKSLVSYDPQGKRY